MSVPAWQRELSKTEYLYLIYTLNIRVAEIFMNKPKKYRSNYSDAVIKNCIDALKFAQMGNSIFMSKTTSEQDYLLRRKYLLSARGLIENIPTISYIFLEHVRKSDSESNEKINNQESYIGAVCADIHKKIGGVLKSDSQIHSKYIK